MTKGNLNNLDKSFVQNLSNNWALVTSGASDNYNMMTVNWGGIGFLWNKPVLFIFIRPERYTIIRKSKFPQNPKRSVRFSGKRTKRSVQKRKARNTQKAETKVL